MGDEKKQTHCLYTICHVNSRIFFRRTTISQQITTRFHNVGPVMDDERSMV